jgi:Tfp pilus assembly pilus retraction ATPase PilT
MHSALNQLIRDAFADSATDVFLIEDEPPRIRREGDVVTLHPGPIPHIAMEEFWKSCGVDPAATLEADISWRVPGGGRLRVNLYHTLGRLAAVLRPIRNDIPPLSELGLPGPLLESWMQRRYGLILITGPTGSGKSTIVASCLDWINQNLSRHIVTLGDPIEFLFINERSLFSQRRSGRTPPASPPACVRRCGRVPIFSSSEKSAIPRPPSPRCTPRRPGT